MGFFGRKSAADLEDLRMAIFMQVTDSATVSLSQKGYDIANDRVLRGRLGKFIAPAMNVLTPNQLNDFARHADRFEAYSQQLSENAQRQFLDELSKRPVPAGDAKGQARYGPNWKSMEFFLGNIPTMSSDDWYALIGGVLSMTSGPKHPAKERMQELKAEGDYASGEAARRLGLDDQVALAEIDAQRAVRDASTHQPFIRACSSLGIPVSGAVPMAEAEASRAARAVILGSDNLDIPIYSVLASGFVRQIMGAAAYEKAQADYADVTAKLRGGRQR